MKNDVTNTKKLSSNAVEITKRQATPPRVLEKTDLSEVKCSNDAEETEQRTENNEGTSRRVNPAQFTLGPPTCGQNDGQTRLKT